MDETWADLRHLSPRGRATRRLAARIGGWRQAASDRVHAAGDARARERGWTVTASTGRFGFDSRIYRDPRFDSLRRPDSPGRGTPPAAPARRPFSPRRTAR